MKICSVQGLKMEKINISPENSSIRADIFLAQYFDTSRKQVSQALEKGLILIDGSQKKSSYKLKGTEIIEYNPLFLQKEDIKILPQNIKLDIKYEDDELLVINKPKGMLTHPSAYEREGTLVNALMYHCGENLCGSDPMRRGIIHRLDKDTSGLMLAAKTDFAAESLGSQIKNKTAKRKYLAIALGEFEQSEGIIDKPLVHYMDKTVKMQIAPEGEGKNALTYYRVLEQFRGAALVELELKTGRTHQIRVHLKSLNHPIFGDNLYGARGALIEKYRGIKVEGQLLQSYFLSFTHPKNNEIMTFELEPADWDSDFTRVLKIIRG